MAEWNIFASRDHLAGVVLAESTTDVLNRNTVEQKVFVENQVGGLRIDVVGAEEVILFLPVLEHVIHGRSGLLVHSFSGVEDVLGELSTFILHRVEQHAVVFFKHRQHGFAAYRGPATEDDGGFVHFKQLLGFFSKQRPVGRAVHDDGFDTVGFVAQFDAASFVDFVKRKQQNVAQRSLADRHGSAERMKNTDFDGFGLRGGGQEKRARRDGEFTKE